MKPHELKKIGTKQERKRRGETKDDKKPNKKWRKGNKTLSKKSEKGAGKKLDKKAIKENESKINVLAHELLAPLIHQFLKSFFMDTSHKHSH
jgi:hypothetical protein